MTYVTDERLKSYLDSNQLARERMCLAVLALDKRFSNVKPRHPRGGPDGGRDIDATFLGTQKAFGAVGFLNQAHDSEDHKKRVMSKFESDLLVALNAEPSLYSFVFFTNVSLTVTEKDDLTASARAKGVVHCEVFDRERIRIALDGPDGFSIRFQYLQMPLSDAEQASFFAKWGDEIQEVISDGFSKLEKNLNRLQFLAETALPLQVFSITLELDREYSADEIGHFRAFCALLLKEPKEPKEPVIGCLFGATDNPGRSQATSVAELDPRNAGVGKGLCGGHWEQRIKRKKQKSRTKEAEFLGEAQEKYVPRSTFTHIGIPKLRRIRIHFSYDGLIRLPPYLLLRDIDEATFALLLNQSLAEKIKAIHVYGNEYKLAEYSRENLRVDSPLRDVDVPMCFTDDELADRWVRIMHDLSPFTVSFSDTTPLRLFSAAEIEDNLK